MKQITVRVVIFLVFVLSEHQLNGQSLPVGTLVLEDYYRREQLLGNLDSSVSFSIRPLFTSSEIKNVYVPDSGSEGQLKGRPGFLFNSAGGKTSLQLLPLSWQQQYNHRTPYGWNDGSMIPSKGYQTMVTTGLFARLGPLDIQFKPEYVYASNPDFETFDMYNGRPDLPPRFGTAAYSKASWGQSSIRLNLGAVSIGLSNENLWWGPGIRNSLLMSNNAQGFAHYSFNSTRPVRIGIGTVEFQVIAGELENSGYYSYAGSDYSDSRYMSAFALSYQPKWIPGLFFGMTRAFQAYRSNIKKLSDYFPFFLPYQKSKVAGFEETYGRNQLTSAFVRWLLPKVNSEIYFEFGANDNAYDWRDFIGSPEHSRAYIIGLNKLISLKSRKDEYIQVGAELTQMSQSIDRLVRPAGFWYEHSQIVQGYTQKGEVIGAGVGPGGNLQSFDLSWTKGVKKIGLQIERYVHNDDFYYNNIGDLNGKSRKWVDLSANMHGTWSYGRMLVNARMQFINSLNYQWKSRGYSSDAYYIPENYVFNLHLQCGLTYQF